MKKHNTSTKNERQLAKSLRTRIVRSPYGPCENEVKKLRYPACSDQKNAISPFASNQTSGPQSALNKMVLEMSLQLFCFHTFGPYLVVRRVVGAGPPGQGPQSPCGPASDGRC